MQTAECEIQYDALMFWLPGKTVEVSDQEDGGIASSDVINSFPNKWPTLQVSARMRLAVCFENSIPFVLGVGATGILLVIETNIGEEILSVGLFNQNKSPAQLSARQLANTLHDAGMTDKGASGYYRRLALAGVQNTPRTRNGHHPPAAHPCPR
jgi:hypothetical protein